MSKEYFMEKILMFFKRYKSLVTNLALAFMLLAPYKYQSAAGANDGTSWVNAYTDTPVTFTVTKTADTDDGICNDDCSLREAINAAVDGSRIDFNISGTITLGSFLPAIGKSLTIDGSGQSVVIDGAGAYLIFDVTSTGDLRLNHLTLTNGHGVGGGGISNWGKLELTDSIVSNNTSTDTGGGIENFGYLTVVGSVISGNTASDRGGGIYNDGGTSNGGGVVILTNSELSNNSSLYGGGIYTREGVTTITKGIFSNNSANDGDGGGIYNFGALSISDSTFYRNSASEAGGIYHSYMGNATLTNSTFLENSATNQGGALYNEASVFDITNSTFTGNTAYIGGGMFNNGSPVGTATLTLINDTLSGNSGTYAGGIYNMGTLNYTNTIIADSGVGVDCYNSDWYGVINVDVNNLVETNGPEGYTCGSPTVTGDPMLSSPANNGGLTQTMALLPGSPAIDAADDASCPATDQRGVARPQGAHCDIGAYEFDGSDAKNLVLNPGFEQQGNSASDAVNWVEGTNHARASDKFHTGGWALHSTYRGAGTDTRTTAPIAVTPNTTYTYSGYIWKTNSTGAACLDMNDIVGEKQLCTSASGSWQFLTGTWNSGSNTSVTLRLITDGSPTGDIWFDDISLVGPGGVPKNTPTPTNSPAASATPSQTQTPTPTASQTNTPPVTGNLVLNSGFETAGTGGTADAAQWTEGTNHTRAADKFHTGGWALHSTYRGAGTDTHVSTPITVNPNTTYTYSGYIWKTNSVGAACMDMNDITGERQLCTSATGSWQFLSGTWNSGSHTSVTLRLITDGSPTGDIWFDDVSLVGSGGPTATPANTNTPAPPINTPTNTPIPPTITNTPPTSGNLVLNSGFETQGTGGSADAANWTEGTNHARASDKFHTGGWSLHSTFRGAGTDTHTSAPIAVSPNTTYTFSGWIWRTNSTGGACLDMNDIAGEKQLCTSTAGSWQFVSGTWSSGSNTSVTLRLITDGSPTGDIWFDDISLK